MTPDRGVRTIERDDEDEMANHRTPDGAALPHGMHAAGRTTDIPAPRATSVWTYGTPAPSRPFPRIADLPADATAPAVPRPAGPPPISPAYAWPAPATVVVAPTPSPASAPDAARRSAADDIAARATTTLIPSSPGARQSRSGPVFVDGSGRRARWFTGIAAAAATLAAGYVGVVVTGALAGPTGPAGTPLPVSSGASLAPATPVLGPPPAPVEAPAVTTKKPTRATTTAPRKTTRPAPKVAPRVVTPVAPPVVPAPVVPPPPAPAAPVAPVVPPAATTKPAPDPGRTTVPRKGTGQNGNAAATAPGTLAT